MSKIDWGNVPHGTEFVVRRVLVSLLLTTLLCGPIALAKEKESAKPIPLFIDPGFGFSQVGTICLAPILDLRTDATSPLALSEKGPRTGFFKNDYIPGADQSLAANFKSNGYQTAACNPVSATLADLTAPSDTWLRKLDFGQSDCLFVLAVKDVCIHCPFAGSGELQGYAVVSGFLFQKRTDAVKMAWRDRAAGVLVEVLPYGGPKTLLETGKGTLAVNDGVMRLLGEFEWRSSKRSVWLYTVAEENFSANCDAVWDKLKDALNKHPKEYKVAFLDAPNRAALYIDHQKIFMEDHVDLKTHGDTCVAQATIQSFQISGSHTDHWNELVKEVRASLSKQ